MEACHRHPLIACPRSITSAWDRHTVINHNWVSAFSCISVHLQSQVNLTLWTVGTKNKPSKYAPSACWAAKTRIWPTKHEAVTQQIYKIHKRPLIQQDALQSCLIFERGDRPAPVPDAVHRPGGAYLLAFIILAFSLFKDAGVTDQKHQEPAERLTGSLPASQCRTTHSLCCWVKKGLTEAAQSYLICADDGWPHRYIPTQVIQVKVLKEIPISA